MGLWLMNLGSAPAASPTGTVTVAPNPNNTYLVLGVGNLLVMLLVMLLG